ncbi:fungal-specific transcription factor domain-containing protein [Hypoxylon crocopeplum]|nr:fungal-specific transcription factor domain-containing protein [Hypoxylon crocopeplum]
MAPDAPVSSPPTSPEASQPQKPRQKRIQVARACDWCRVHRVKCDNHLPCSNCQKRGGRCSQGAVEVRTLPHAYRKIEQLESRVRELEQELENARKAARSGPGLGTPYATPLSLASSEPPGTRTAGAFDPSSDEEKSLERKRLGDGIHIRTPRSQQETWYGPSSLFYFIRRVNTSLNQSLRQSRSIDRMLPDSANKLFDGPTQLPAKDQRHQPTLAAEEDSVTMGDYLTPTQEEYFISLFWQSYHTTLVVLDEASFKEHYQSLWTTSSRERKPSALVDIVIALCMQYGVAQQSGSAHVGSVAASPRVHKNDATIAGRWHYQRCQRLLTSELETPTILTLQCQILSYAYLCSGSFPNMADSTCTLAVRTAYMLGLHLDPPLELPQREREMRKRLWWTLYILDSKINMKLGRPFLLDNTYATCSLPRDDREIATLSGSTFPPLEDEATWLTFNLQNIKLFLTVRSAYAAFYKKQLSVSNDYTSRDDSKTIESNADHLSPYIDRIDDWVKGVPNVIRTKRQDNGIPLSTDFSPLEIEQFASPWLQRQRLLLELMYNNLCINIFRPFIRFAPATTPTPLTDRIAARCAAHAISSTRIMHQVLSSTSLITGWHEAFQWQWNATMSLIGFVIAYPKDDLTPAARSAIDLSVAVFEVFGQSLSTAASAAIIARDLGSQADLLTKQMQGSQDSTQKEEDVPLAIGSWGPPGNENFTSTTLPAEQALASTWNYDSGTTVPMQGMWVDSMDMAFPVDMQDFGMSLWPNMNNDVATYWPIQQLQV